MSINELTDSPIKKLLSRLVFSILFALAVLCLLAFCFHRSDQPWVFSWSLRYLLGAIAPILALIGFQLILSVARPLSKGLETFLTYSAVLIGFLAPFIGTRVLAQYELRVMVLFLGILTVILAVHRASRRTQWLLSYVTVGFVCLLIFVPELLGHIIEGRAAGEFRIPRWGDNVTFRYMFPTEEPFIGPGGRLRPNLRVKVFSGRFREPYQIVTNSAGFRNSEEIPLRPKADELRVLNLGDSFSIGCGVDQTSFLGSLLESDLNRFNLAQKVRVMNAEVSDPAYGLLNLHKYGLAYSPNVVVYGLVDNDLHQNFWAMSTGGILSLEHGGGVRTHPTEPAAYRKRILASQEHFAQKVYPKGNPRHVKPLVHLVAPFSQLAKVFATDFSEFRTSRFLSAPFLRFESRNLREGELTILDSLPGRQTSGHLRLFDSLTNLGMLYREDLPEAAELLEVFFPVLEEYQRICREKGALFLLMYYPRRIQVQPQDWMKVCEFWNMDPSDFDLDKEATTLRTFCEQKGILFCDLTASFRSAAKRDNLFLKNDDHLNENGHAVAAIELGEFIRNHLGTTSPSSNSNEESAKDSERAR